MSSYLSIFAKVKGNKQPILLVSYSRCSEIYTRFYDYGGIAYIGNEEAYTTITEGMLDCIIKDIDNDLNLYQKKVSLYKQLSDKSQSIVEVVDEIYNLEIEISNLADTKSKFEFIKDMVEESEDTHIEYLCNID